VHQLDQTAVDATTVNAFKSNLEVGEVEVCKDGLSRGLVR